MNTFSFCISSLIIILLPGTGVLYTISTAAAKGKRAGLYAAAGCTAGILPHLCLSIAFSSALLQAGSGLFHIVQTAGALYLVYLGAGMICKSAEISLGVQPEAHDFSGIIRRGILINLLNPKLTLFFFSFLPQYLRIQDQTYLFDAVSLGLLFMLITFLVFACYALLAGSAGGFMASKPRFISILQKGSGLFFIISAFRLWLA